MTQDTRSFRNTDGFTLIEVMVSIMILSVGSLAMGSMLLRATRQAGATATAGQQTAQLSGEVSRMQAVPFAQLATGTTCVNITNPTATRCTTINNVSTNVMQVTVVVSPSGNPLLHPITSTFTRTISGNGNPLKTQ